MAMGRGQPPLALLGVAAVLVSGSAAARGAEAADQAVTAAASTASEVAGTIDSTPLLDRKVARAATPPAGDTLLINKGGELLALSLKDKSGRLRRIGDAGLHTLVDPTGSYTATLDDVGVTFRSLQSGRLVAVVPGADAAAFYGDRLRAVVSRPLRPTPAEEGDCSTPTSLEAVDLRAGVPIPLFTAPGRLLPEGASDTHVLVNAVSADCSTTKVELLDIGSQQLKTVATGRVEAHTPELDRIWILRPPTGQQWHGWGEVYDVAGRIVGRTEHLSSAAYSRHGALLYSEYLLGSPGTPDAYLADKTYVSVTKSHPRATDRRKSFPNEGNLVWDVNGKGVALRRARDSSSDELQAWYCSVPTLACRSLPLTWRDDVELLAILPSSQLPPP